MFIVVGFLKRQQNEQLILVTQARQRWEQECFSLIPNDIKSSLGYTEVSKSSLACKGHKKGLSFRNLHNLLFLPNIIILLLEISLLLSISHQYWDHFVFVEVNPIQLSNTSSI